MKSQIAAGTVWLAGLALSAAAPHWRFESALTGGHASELEGKAGVFGLGAPPEYDSDIPGEEIWDGGTYAQVGPANRHSLRFAAGVAEGTGSPVGGEVTVPGDLAELKPAGFAVEAFVRMKRQTTRHALLVSKRRNGQTGASWSLSIDPQGAVRARFDTQPGADAKSGPGFNQSFGSSGSVADGAWHHVALTFDSGTHAAAIFVDHVRCGGGVTAGPLVYDDGPLVLGRGLDGWLDEVRLSAGVLHPEQFLRTCRYFSDLKPRSPAVAMLDQTPSRVQTALALDWPELGTLRPKCVGEMGTSMWSLGCETLDRDLANWDAYKDYLPPLGIRHIRLQGGWGRTETKKGVYDFSWLDRIVDEAQTRGLTVCLETSYGNRLYDPKAALGPGGTLPEGEQTLAAWDRWVEEMAQRYSARGVGEWMMYNEPNLVKDNTIEKTAAFNVRTAEIIKSVDPKARIAGLVSCSASPEFVGGFVRLLKAQGQLGLFDSVVYHHYSANPDATYDKVVALQAIVREQAPALRLWQGEAGCASEEVQFALSGVEWTELSQAKWNLRRMLGDLSRGIRSSVFTITDLSYHKDFISRYGLLKTDATNAIIKVKTAYYAVQNAVSVFNDSLEPDAGASLTLPEGSKLTGFAYRDKATRLGVVALWDGASVPSNLCAARPVTVTVRHGVFKDPVWLDLLTGKIHAIPADRVAVEAESRTFRDLPVYDSPVVILDQSLLKFEPARLKKKSDNPMAAAGQ